MQHALRRVRYDDLAGDKGKQSQMHEKYTVMWRIAPLTTSEKYGLGFDPRTLRIRRGNERRNAGRRRVGNWAYFCIRARTRQFVLPNEGEMSE